jgi:hypothetical protein
MGHLLISEDGVLSWICSQPPQTVFNKQKFMLLLSFQSLKI